MKLISGQFVETNPISFLARGKTTTQVQLGGYWGNIGVRYFILVQACLRVPPVVADEAKLAIVFTYFFSFLAQAACVRHA